MLSMVHRQLLDSLWLFLLYVALLLRHHGSGLAYFLAKSPLANNICTSAPFVLGNVEDINQ